MTTPEGATNTYVNENDPTHNGQSTLKTKPVGQSLGHETNQAQPRPAPILSATPTPLGLIGYCLSLSPLSIDLMGWRGAGGAGAATTGVFFFVGGLLLIITCVLEFIQSNTFKFVVFGTYGAFFLSYGATLTPFYDASTAYDPQNLNPLNPGFHASFAFYLLFVGILTFFFLIASVRLNVVFMSLFLCLTVALELLAGAYWQLANGRLQLANKLQIAGGAFAFVSSLAGWYLILGLVLVSAEFPFSLPVGDLSRLRSKCGETT